MSNAERTETETPAEPEIMFPTLTRRERAIAKMLAAGDRNRDVSKVLGISAKTVDTHRSHILKKLDCRNNVELCRLAIREGYMAP